MDPRHAAQPVYRWPLQPGTPGWCWTRNAHIGWAGNAHMGPSMEP